MPDFIGETRAKQRAAARKLIARQNSKLAPALEAQLQAAIAEAHGADRGLDLELARQILNSELERDVYMALVGYTDWLASRLWRDYGMKGASSAEPPSPPPATERLPVCDDDAQARISRDYHVDAEPLNLVLNAVEVGLELPPIGHVDERRVLHMTWETISKWANLYDWNSSGG